MISVPIDAVTALMKETAKEIVLPRFRELRADDIMEKGPGDIVTVADLESEEKITPRLLELIDGSVVIGEEAVSKDASVLERFDSDGPVWLIDPIDGTKNFAEGDARFCIMIGLVYRGETIAGWIHDPTTGQTAIAEKGAGAKLEDAPLRVSPNARPLSAMIGQVNYGTYISKDRSKVRTLVAQTFEREEKIRCAGHDFLGQCVGSRDFALYRRLWSWDHVPGALILAEAGGKVSRLDGLPYRPQDRVEKVLAARNEDTWEAVHDLLAKNELTFQD